MLYGMLKAEFTRNPFTPAASRSSRTPVLRAFKRRVDPRRHNGATLIGLKGVVVKSHGSADALAFQHASAQGVHGSRARHARQDRAADGRDALDGVHARPLAEATVGDA